MLTDRCSGHPGGRTLPPPPRPPRQTPASEADLPVDRQTLLKTLPSLAVDKNQTKFPFIFASSSSPDWQKALLSQMFH